MRSRAAGLCLAVALVGALGAALATSACVPGDAAPDHVTAAVLPYMTFTPFHIAQTEGYFAEQNLEVEFVRLVSVQDFMFLLADGGVDVAAGWVSSALLNSIAHGVRARLVATLGHLDPDACTFNAFVARRELVESGALEDPARIRDLRFDLDLVTPQGYWADLALAPHGLTVDDVHIVNLPPQVAVEALRSGNVDVTNASEPFIDSFLREGDAEVWKVTSGLVPGYSDSAVMYGASLLDERRGVGERFAIALLRGMRQFDLGKTPHNLAMVEEFTGLEADRAATLCWPAMPDDPRVNLAGLHGYQRWSIERGLADRLLSDDELVDHAFVAAALQALEK